MCLIPLPDQLHAWLLEQAQTNARKARAPGTYANHATAIKAYLAFAYRFGIDPTAPSVPDACACIQYISTYLKSPASISNYVSAVRVYLRERGVITSAMNSHRMGLALDAFARQKLHKVRQMNPLTDQQVASTIRLLWDKYRLNALVLGIQLMYYAGLRQSEVAPPSTKAYDPTRHTTRMTSR